MESRVHLPLFATKLANGLIFFSSILRSFHIHHHILHLFLLTHLFSTPTRWNPIFRSTFKSRLSSRYAEEALSGVDFFVCMTDPVIEPPIMVINTVLSVMAYDYSSKKLRVYMSDDGCSDLMFYALLETTRFSQVWVSFCKKLKVEPRSPEICFRNTGELNDDSTMPQHWFLIKGTFFFDELNL